MKIMEYVFIDTCPLWQKILIRFFGELRVEKDDWDSLPAHQMTFSGRVFRGRFYVSCLYSDEVGFHLLD